MTEDHFHLLQSDIRAAFDRLDISGTGGRARTTAIKTALAGVGLDRGYWVQAAGINRNDDRDWSNARGEWLFDVTWIEYGPLQADQTHPLLSLPLAAESEFGNFEAIWDDFEKLLVANAAIKLMIFPSEDENEARRRIDCLMRHATGSMKNTQTQSYYMFATFLRKTGKFYYAQNGRS